MNLDSPDWMDCWIACRVYFLICSFHVEWVCLLLATGRIYNFTDVFDSRPSAGHRSSVYNAVTKVLGFLYHDVAGGNRAVYKC